MSSCCDDLREDRDGDLLWRNGTEIEPRRRLQAPDPILGQLPPPQALDDGGRPLAARDEADVPRSCSEHPFQRLLVRVAVRGDHDRRPDQYLAHASPAESSDRG